MVLIFITAELSAKTVKSHTMQKFPAIQYLDYRGTLGFPSDWLPPPSESFYHIDFYPFYMYMYMYMYVVS